MKRSLQEDASLRLALRVTGNLAFVPFALSLALPSRSRMLWRAFLGVHAVHASLIASLALRERGAAPFSPVSRIGGAVGYMTVLTLSATDRHQRAGHNILLGLHAFTIGHGYVAKGRNARAYAPLAALWLAAARGLDRRWRR